MSHKHASDIISTEDLLSSIITNESETTNNKIRALIIVPGGGGKTTLVNCLQSTNINCADIDYYWDQEKEKEYINKLTFEWKNACLDIKNREKRHQIEDEYVLLKSILSKEKWSNEYMLDILFVQTFKQASLLMDKTCFSLNLLPTIKLHHHNLNLRSSSIEHAPDDFDVCIRQWKENEQHKPYVLYDNFEEFQHIVSLFHQFVLSKR
ncbi:unnamed protein product [Rotaria sordida]|uniref:Uncharacterized protein n=1 Tax=Rotaria sordida TaxID=392033 RepID=A0A815G4B8_9BILA|nr:unnamed protein product [Rotaria sordida]CAF1593145.1 unnamed protein product [Rotaria sordida]